MSPANHKQETDAEKTSRIEELESAQVEIEGMEAGDTVPQDANEWPTGRAKYLTFGSGSDDAYGEGPTAKLGPAGLEHHAGGAVSIGGKKVDNPEDYKGTPIPGGPTDPSTPQLAGERAH